MALVSRPRARLARGRNPSVPSSHKKVNPFRIHEYAHGRVEEVPDPIEFVVSDKYLNRPNLYPRQATALKIQFLRLDMLTQYDYDVIGEWEDAFRQTGQEGCSPGILDRIKINQDAGRSWFRETLGVIGRRGGKGYWGALSGSYVLWNYMHRPGGPQAYYGIDRDKRLTAIVFAGKKEQARDNLWRDWFNVVTGGPCFAPYISRAQAERLTIFAPTDILKQERLEASGLLMENDIASFEIVPAPSTVMAARGPASFALMFDEQAHVISSTAASDAEQVYDACLDPETRVLTANFEWKRIDDLAVGEALVAIDEEPSGRPGVPRKMREAVVEAKWDTYQRSYRITFDDETSVVCSGNHRWMSLAGRDMVWKAIEVPARSGSAGHPGVGLRAGDRIKAMFDPWEIDRTYDGGYLSGIADGEGYVSFGSQFGGGSATIGITQKPGPVLDRTKAILDDHGFSYSERFVPSSGVHILVVARMAQVVRLLGQFDPTRLRSNFRTMWQGHAFRNGATKTIVSIEPLSEQRLVDLQTSTKTFIAEGLVSHNSTPSLDQFGKDGFIYAPSSPWRKTGKFFENWELSIEMDRDEHGAEVPAYPSRWMLQLPSWGPYEDWEEAHRIPLRPPTKTIIEVEVEVKKRKTVQGKSKTIVVLEKQDVERLVPGPCFQPLKSAVQTFDDEMRLLQRANPDTFAVERLSHWAESLDAYLNPVMVSRMFQPWNGQQFVIQHSGPLSETYVGHGDPANTNKRFGWSMAHRVWVPDPDPEKQRKGDGQYHVVFDRIDCWDPADYEDHTLDYDDVMGDIEGWVKAFVPEDVSFDQFNVPATMGRLRKFVARESLPKRVNVREVSRTRPLNWKHAELFKAALNMGLIHAPMLKQDGEINFASSEAETELKFLEEKNGAVDHPTSGPVQTKDIADTIMECVVTLIGKQMATFLGYEFEEAGLSGGAPRGTDPYRNTTADRMGEALTSATARPTQGAARSRGSGMRRR